jgi:hypothetical protein
MTPDEIHELEQRMDALAREYGTTHDRKILVELKTLNHARLYIRSEKALQNTR